MAVFLFQIRHVFGTVIVAFSVYLSRIWRCRFVGFRENFNFHRFGSIRAEIGVKKRIFIVFPVVEIIQNRTLFYN